MNKLFFLKRTIISWKVIIEDKYDLKGIEEGLQIKDNKL